MSYSEAEAARKLGVTVEHLRRLVRSHMMPEGDMTIVDRFRPSDLVVLRILAQRSIAPTE